MVTVVIRFACDVCGFTREKSRTAVIPGFYICGIFQQQLVKEGWRREEQRWICPTCTVRKPAKDQQDKLFAV